MTGEPQIRFPEASQPDAHGWWPAAHCDAPGGLGDVSALPSLNDAGITHPPSAKTRLVTPNPSADVPRSPNNTVPGAGARMVAPGGNNALTHTGNRPAPKRVSVIKDDHVRIEDAPVPPKKKPHHAVAGRKPADPKPTKPAGEPDVDELTRKVMPAFTTDEMDAILASPEADPALLTPRVPQPSNQPQGNQPSQSAELSQRGHAPQTQAPQQTPARSRNDQPEPKAPGTPQAEPAHTGPVMTVEPASTPLSSPTPTPTRPILETAAEASVAKDVASEHPTSAPSISGAPAAGASSLPTPAPATGTDTPAMGGASAQGARPPVTPGAQDTGPILSVTPAPESPPTQGAATAPGVLASQEGAERVLDAKNIPISPPAPSIPADDTDSFIVESFTEDTDSYEADAVAMGMSPFAPVPSRSNGRWGRAGDKYQQAIDRNLANREAPLDVLFAVDHRGRERRMALRPSFGRDLLVWVIAIMGVGQLLLRGWAILPTLNTFNANLSDMQLLSAISLMVGGAIGGVLALIAVRFITGMRSALPWMIGVLLIFGVFPWYGFGSQLAPTGLPPFPSPIDVVVNPVFDPSGLLSLSLIVLAICAVVAMVTAFMVGTPRRS